MVAFGIRHRYRQIYLNTAHATQTCDAKNPCITCINADKATECEYEISGTPPSHFDHSQFLSWDGFGPSGSRDVYRREAVEEMISEPPTSQPPVSVRTRLAPETVPPGRMLIRPLAYSLLFCTPPGPRPRTLNDIMTHNFSQVTLPPFSVISSPSVPPGPHVILSSLGAGGFQLSDVSLGELNMKLYVSQVC